MSTVRCSPRGTASSSACSRGPDGGEPAERRKLLLEQRVVAERPLLGFRLEEEVERIDRRHVGDEIDRDVEMRDALGEHDAGEVVALRVLLPVDEMRLGFDDQRIGQDRRAGVRRRAQADGLRPERDQPVVAVGRAVGQRDGKRHLSRLCWFKGGPARRSFCGGLCNAARTAACSRIDRRPVRDGTPTERSPRKWLKFCGSSHR